MGSFSVQEYEAVYAKMASVVGVPYEDFRTALGLSYKDREVGKYASMEDNIELVCNDALGIEVDVDQINRVAAFHYNYIRRVITQPSERALEGLRGLRQTE